MTERRRHSSISTMSNLEYAAQTNNNNHGGTGDQYCFKVITLGNVGVGKSTLISTYTQFNDEQDGDMCPSFAEKHITRHGKRIKLDIWDTAGQERYDSITHNYYRSAHGCLLCFDVCDERSSLDLMKWYEKFRMYSDSVETPMILVGTKSDLRQSPLTQPKSLDDCKLLAMNLGLDYMEVSSRKRDTVDSVFETLIDRMDSHYHSPTYKRSITLKLKPKEAAAPCSACIAQLRRKERLSI